MQAVIFDMDGLMIESEGNQSLSFEKVLREHGIEPELNEAGIVQTVGVRAADNWERLKAQHNLAASIEELLARKQEIYWELLQEGVTAMPGLAALITELHAAAVKKAIASSSARQHIDVVVGHLRLDEYLDVIVSGEEVPNSKPSPDIFLETARRLGVLPDNCIVLEDAQEGVKAAKAAGMKVVAVPNRYTRAHDFDVADLIVPSLTHLNVRVLDEL